MQTRKHSRKRDAILELIRSSKTHPSAQWVYKQLKPRFPDLSQGTVYRNIKVLFEEGELVSAGVINGEEHFDGEPLPHSHAVCKSCGMIIDIPAKTGTSARRANASVDSKNRGSTPEMEIFAHFSVIIPGFTIDIRNTVFYGLCNGCKSAG